MRPKLAGVIKRYRTIKVFLLQNHGPETYEVESIVKNLCDLGADARSVMLDNLNDELPDIALLRNTRGSDYKKLKSMKNVKFINDLDNHYLTSDKWKKYKKLMGEGLRVPKTLLIPLPFEYHHIQMIGDEIGFPCVLKRRYGAHGIGVELCHDADHMYMLAKEFIRKFHDTDIIAQKYVNYSNDILSLFWVGGIVKSHVAKAPKDDTSFLSYRKIGYVSSYTTQNETSNEVISAYTSSRIPWVIDNDLRNTVEPVMTSLGLDIARLDILFDSDGYTICEVNSPGGFKGFEKIHNISVGSIIANFIMKVAQ